LKENRPQIQSQNPPEIGPKSALKSAENQTKIDLKIGPNSAQNHSQNQLKLVLKIVSKLSPKSSQDRHIIVKNYFKIDPKSSIKSAKIIFKIVTKSSQNRGWVWGGRGGAWMGMGRPTAAAHSPQAVYL
jgi:hypothetical protein